ncbi:MAG: pseudouridine-5'-phosphate glycosidase [Gammaproteobacteria bacterium]|nr:pseudouridine-5'-phosphate glycosidase [Gammaproteobacteria bacterium]
MRGESPHQHDIHPDVCDALDNHQPVVALESTIISHGMPYPRNVETAMQVEETVRANGATPATIAILNGRLKIGLAESELEYLGRTGTEVTKTSRRDIPFIVSQERDGATTVAATILIAGMVGIRVMATGGIGGVHRGVEATMDISADLDELARNTMAVVCAGIKSVLDVGRTLEYLETVGVPVVGFKTDTVPAFYARDSEFPVDYRVDDASAVAAALQAKASLGIDGAILVTNPVPKEHALESSEINRLIDEALSAMNERGITGKDTTPYLLARIAEQSGGKSLDANIALVVNNARVASEIASAYCAASEHSRD